MVTLKKARRGVSLIENLVAMLIFSMAALGYITLSATLSKNSGESEIASQAAVVAQSVADELHTVPFASQDQETNDLMTFNAKTVGYTKEGLVNDQGEETFYVATTNVTYISSEIPPYAEVTVSVSWADSVYAQSQTGNDVLSFVEVNFSRTVDK